MSRDDPVEWHDLIWKGARVFPEDFAENVRTCGSSIRSLNAIAPFTLPFLTAGMVRVLLDAKAEVDRRDKGGNDALALALMRGDWDLTLALAGVWPAGSPTRAFHVVCSGALRGSQPVPAYQALLPRLGPHQLLVRDQEGDRVEHGWCVEALREWVEAETSAFLQGLSASVNVFLPVGAVASLVINYL